MTDFGWILTETIEVVLEWASEAETVVTVVEMAQPEWEGRRAVLRYDGTDLTFDGERIETEKFTSYLAVVDAPIEYGSGRVTLYGDPIARAEAKP